MGSVSDLARSAQAAPDAPGIARRIQAMLAAGVDAPGEDFDGLALEIFPLHYDTNVQSRAFCEALGVNPAEIREWRDIPAFPCESFKKALVTSFPFDQAVMAQLTGGTTAIVRGQIFRDEIGRQLVLEANRVMTEAYLFPDFALNQRCRVLILAPSPEMAPSMGMAIGMEETRRHFGTADSRFLLNHGGIDIGAMVEALAQSESSGVPIAMIGSTSAFVYFFNACKKRGISFHLPYGSRIGDGGGYRGRFGEMTQENYWQLAWEVLGIPYSHCVNVLGMAESATNFFDDSLRRTVKGLPTQKRMRPCPPWTRTVAVGADDLRPLPAGEVGLLRHYDLVNLPTVLAVQTDNLGYVDAVGNFQIIGRAQQDKETGKVSTTPSERTVGPMGDNFAVAMFACGMIDQMGHPKVPILHCSQHSSLQNMCSIRQRAAGAPSHAAPSATHWQFLRRLPSVPRARRRAGSCCRAGPADHLRRQYAAAPALRRWRRRRR